MAGGGKSVKSLKRVGGAVIGATPGGKIIQGIHAGLRGGKAGKRRRRSRGMFMRKGRVYMGFSQADVKAAMRRVYGGRARRRK